MFKNNHYIPILRWKAAEKEALGNSESTKKSFMTPMIEFVMPQSKERDGDKLKTPEVLLKDSINAFQRSLPKIPDEILKYWGQNPVFISVHLIDGSIRAQALLEILSLGQKLNLFLIPVVSAIPEIDFESDIKTRKVAITFAKKYKHGLCIRLLRSDLHQKSFSTNIKAFLKENGLNEKDLDLLVDFQVVDEKYRTLVDLLSKIPNLIKWRTFTVGSGAFPVDLSEFEIGENYRERSDWKNWTNQAIYAKILRKPSFADYTILHPVGTEAAQFFSPSASIRYTLEDRWLVMRGQKGKRQQYLANARLISGLPIFCGADFSKGDEYIREKGKDLDSEKTGNPKTWLSAGINHHLAYVVSQIANQSG